MNIVKKGRTFDFDFELSGDSATAFTTTFNVYEFPDVALDTPITRAMTVSGNKYIGSLTGTETASLSAGHQYFIDINAVDSDENLGSEIKIYIGR